MFGHVGDNTVVLISTLNDTISYIRRNLRISLSGTIVWSVSLSTEDLYGWVTGDTILLAEICLLRAVTIKKLVSYW